MNPGSWQDRLRESIRQLFRQSFALVPVAPEEIPEGRRLVLVRASDDPGFPDSKKYLLGQWKVDAGWFELPFVAGIRCSVASPRPFAPGVQWGVDLDWSDQPALAFRELMKRVRHLKSLRRNGADGLVFLSPDELGAIPVIDALAAVLAGGPVWLLTGIQNGYRLSVVRWLVRAAVVGLIKPADGAVAFLIYLLLRVQAGVRLP